MKTVQALVAVLAMVQGVQAAAQVKAVDLFRQGAQQLASGRLDEAIESYEKGVQLKPDSKEGWYNLGVAYGRKHRYSQEVKAYLKALELDPNYVNALHNLGLAYRDLGRKDKAVEVLGKAVKLDPGAADAWNNLGVILLEQDKIDQAADAFRKAAKADPDNADCRFNLGIALMKRAAKETSSERREPWLRKAIEAYEAALAADPKYYRAAYNEGIVYHELGQPESEIQAYKRAISIKAGYRAALYNLAVALSAKGADKQALDAWKEYVKNATGDINERPFLDKARKEIERLKKVAGE